MKVVITATSFCRREDLKEFAREKLRGADLRFGDPEVPLAGEALIDFTRGADALIVGREPIDAAYLDAVPSVRHIAVYGVGSDNIDAAACEARGVSVLIARGVNAQAAAEHTIGLMLAVCRNIGIASAKLRQGQWVKNGGVQLSGRTVAVIGCGHIGSRVARMLSAAFGCQVLLVDIVDKTNLAQEIGAEVCNFRDALARAEVVTFHVPLTDKTRGMLGAAELAWLSPEAVVINTSRGPAIDQEALKAALRQGRLRGAGLDVFVQEPLTDPDLYRLDNLVATPHIAGNAWEAVTAMGQAAVLEITAVLGLSD